MATKQVKKKAKPKKPKQKQKAAKRFARKRGKPVVFLFLDDIDSSHPIHLERELRGKNVQELELVINSPGGNAHAAYQLMAVARHHGKKVDVCVPYFAKSAATLLCLGADTIIVGEVAELGPLDTQIRVKEAAGKYSYQSALNPAKAIDQLRRFSMETFDLAVRMILARSDLDHDSACDHAIDFVKATTGQLFSGVEAIKLGEYSRALAVGKEYGSRLLERYGKFSDSDRRKVLDKLVEGYPSHDFIIDYTELKGLGFSVEILEAESLAVFAEVFREAQNTKNLIEWVEP